MKTKLILPDEFTDYDLWLMPQKGYLGCAVVETPEGRRHSVFFYDPIRIRQDLETGVAHGEPYVAEKGMILLSEVTLEAAASAVERLYAQGFFGAVD